MRKFNLSRTQGFLILALVTTFILQSCSTHQGITSSSQLRNTSHHLMTMHGRGYHQPEVAKTDAQGQPADASATSPARLNVEKIDPTASASVSNELTGITNNKDLLKKLTTDERLQVRDQFAKSLAKSPMLKKLALTKWDKMAAKTPAPTQSVLHPGGGSLSIGEILAIVSIACAVTWVLGIAAIVCGAIALVKIKNGGGANWARILAIVGIVLGCIDLITLIIWIALFAVAFGAVGVI